MMAPQDPASRLERLERENALLRLRLNRLEQEARSMRPVVEQVKRLRLWDFTLYGARPDEGWVAVDRAHAGALLAALAGVDHWRPWTTPIEPRTRR